MGCAPDLDDRCTKVSSVVSKCRFDSYDWSHSDGWTGCQVRTYPKDGFPIAGMKLTWSGNHHDYHCVDNDGVYGDWYLTEDVLYCNAPCTLALQQSCTKIGSKHFKCPHGVVNSAKTGCVDTPSPDKLVQRYGGVEFTCGDATGVWKYGTNKNGTHYVTCDAKGEGADRKEEEKGKKIEGAAAHSNTVLFLGIGALLVVVSVAAVVSRSRRTPPLLRA